MSKQKEYFELKLKSLRIIGGWAADCAEKALPIYQELHTNDSRPHDAINGIRHFANGGKRIAKLRVLALDAYRAALETTNLASAAAAQAACLAASSAYTHPFADLKQAEHIFGSAAYAALATELKKDNDPNCGNAEVRWAIERAPKEVCEVLLNMPSRATGKGRLNQLMYDLDLGLRNKFR
jgi:hypothetical protein